MTHDTPTIFLAGGGTGGHLYPGIAVAEHLREEMAAAQVVFLCTRREIDRAILEPTGFEFIEQPVIPLSRSISGLLRFWRGWRETVELVRQQFQKRRPAAVLGLGGYAAGVAVRLGQRHGIPTALLNPDVIPGKANQYLMRRAAAVCCQFEQTREHVSTSRREKLRITGCPIRRDIQHLPERAAASARLGLEKRLNTLTITGASQGAQTVNDAVLATLGQVKLHGWQVLHLAGREHAEQVRRGYQEMNLAARVVDFTPAMADVWSVTDLAISRSGASTCAELTACGIPSILLPYPFHKDMHQRANAQVLAEAGAALLLEDKIQPVPNAQALRPALEPLLHDASRRQAMSAAARALGKPDAAGRVAEVLREIIAA